MLAKLLKLDGTPLIHSPGEEVPDFSPGVEIANLEFRHPKWPSPPHGLKKVTFRNVGLSKTTIAKTTFTNCAFEDCLFIGTRFQEVEFHNCSFVDCTFYKVRFERTYLDPGTIRFARRYEVEASNAGVGLFQALLANYSAERQEDFYAEADIRFRRWKRHQLAYDQRRGNVAKWTGRYRRATSCLYEWSAGFGYRPGRFFVLTIALFIVVSCVNFLMIGNDITVTGRQAHPAGFAEAVFYTFSVLTVLGFSTVVPTSAAAELLTVAEALASIGWLGIFTALLVKRFLR